MRLISRRMFIGRKRRYAGPPRTPPRTPPPFTSSVGPYPATAINEEGVPVTGQLDRTLSGEIVKFTGSEPGRSFNEAF